MQRAEKIGNAATIFALRRLVLVGDASLDALGL